VQCILCVTSVAASNLRLNIVEDDLSVITLTPVTMHHIEEVEIIRLPVVNEIILHLVDVSSADTILLRVAAGTILLHLETILHQVGIIHCQEVNETLMFLLVVMHLGIYYSFVWHFMSVDCILVLIICL